MGYYKAIAGGVLDTIGTAFMGAEADARKQKQEELANTPGLDFTSLTQQALGGYNTTFDAATGLAGRLSAANQAQLTAREEQALPGIGAARQSALAKIGGLFSDDSAWLKGLQRRGAAMNVGRGLFGSQAGQIATLRLSDQESQQRLALGTSLLGSLISNMRIANTPGAQAFLGPSVSDQIAMRGQERAQRIGLLSSANAMPSALEVWGSEMQQVGKSMAGVGMGEASQGQGGFGGGGGGGGDNWNTSYFNSGDAATLAQYGMG